MSKPGTFSESLKILFYFDSSVLWSLSNNEAVFHLHICMHAHTHTPARKHRNTQAREELSREQLFLEAEQTSSEVTAFGCHYLHFVSSYSKVFQPVQHS